MNRPSSLRPAGPAKVLIFTGVWRERLSAPEPRKPMFEEPAPAKPGPKKTRRKNG